MDIWINSRGNEQDYSWIYRDRQRKSQIPEWGNASRCLDASSPGIVIWFDGHHYGIAIGGLKTGQADGNGRAIRLKFVVWGIDREEEARSIAKTFLDQWETRVQELRSLYSFSDLPESEGWEFDFKRCEILLNGWIEGNPVQKKEKSGRAVVEVNDGPGSKSWEKLSNELSECTLPSGLGAHLVVTKYPSFEFSEVTQVPWRALVKEPNLLREAFKKNGRTRPLKSPMLRPKPPISGASPRRNWILWGLCLLTGLMFFQVMSKNRVIKDLKKQVKILQSENEVLIETTQELTRKIDKTEKKTADDVDKLNRTTK